MWITFSVTNVHVRANSIISIKLYYFFISFSLACACISHMFYTRQKFTLSESRSTKGWRSSSLTCEKRVGFLSADVRVRISIAVNFACFLVGTKTMTGLSGLYLRIQL